MPIAIAAEMHVAVVVGNGRREVVEENGCRWPA
jgi:hypothetical protein